MAFLVSYLYSSGHRSPSILHGDSDSISIPSALFMLLPKWASRLPKNHASLGKESNFNVYWRMEMDDQATLTVVSKESNLRQVSEFCCRQARPGPLRLIILMLYY